MPLSLLAPYRMNSPRTDHDDDVTEDERRVGAELVTADGAVLPLASATLRARAEGGLARTVLEQTFENPHTETLHVTYKMPLPADGAVSGYEFTIGERTIKGIVEPKAKAREQFEQAILEGRTAALLEQQRTDIFTQEIGNIPAGATIVARITVDQRLAWLPEGEWELRFPTVIGPRYVGTTDTEEDARAVEIGLSPAEGIRARIDLEVDVRDELAGGRGVASPSHALRSSEGQSADDLKRTVYRLAAAEGARLDRDIVVRWPVARKEVGLSLAVARPEAKRAHAHLAYGLLTIVPPAPDARFPAVPRDLIVLLDTSGSMNGTPLEQAKRVVALLVDSLDEADRIELIEFSNMPRAWKREPQAATADVKKQAIAWVQALNAGGATEMYSAVVDGLRALRPGAQRQVVLVTDGYIGGEEKIVDLLHERLPVDCRMHVVGVGSAVNRSLATAIARAGRGAEVLVGPTEDAERAAKRLLDRTRSPVLTDVSVGGGGVIEVAPVHVPDVFANAPVVAAVKLAADGGDVIVRGKLAGGATWERTLRAPAVTAGEGNQGVVALFAREHVADLEMRWTIGREAEMIDRTIERTGVVFQIATRMTSWLAIDDQRTVDPTSGTRRAVQPQELPFGTSMSSFGFAPPSQSTRAGGVSLAFALRPSRMAPAGAPPPMPQSIVRTSVGSAPPAQSKVVAPKTRRSYTLSLIIALIFFILVALAVWVLRR